MMSLKCPNLRYLFASVLAIASTQLCAEHIYFAYSNDANVSAYGDIAIEGNVKVLNSTLLGGRATYKVTNSFAVYGDLALGSVEDHIENGISYGGGFIVEHEGLFSDFLPKASTAIVVDIHLGSYDYSYANYYLNDLDYTFVEVGSSFLVSHPIEGLAMPISAYAQAGLHYITTKYEECYASLDSYSSGGCYSFDDSSIELGLGVGAVIDLGPGEVFSGVEYINGLSIAAGYRISF